MAKGKAQTFGNNFGKKGGNGKQYLGSTSSSSSISVSGKDKSVSSGPLYWSCGKPGHFSDKCPQKRVNFVTDEGQDPYLGLDDETWFDR